MAWEALVRRARPPPPFRAGHGSGPSSPCTRGAPSRYSCDLLPQPCLEGCVGKVQQPVGLVDGDRAEPERLPGSDLPDAPDVERADGRNLRVAAGGLPIDQQDDRQTVSGDLDRAERDAVRNDVVRSE